MKKNLIATLSVLLCGITISHDVEKVQGMGEWHREGADSAQRRALVAPAVAAPVRNPGDELAARAEREAAERAKRRAAREAAERAEKEKLAATRAERRAAREAGKEAGQDPRTSGQYEADAVSVPEAPLPLASEREAAERAERAKRRAAREAAERERLAATRTERAERRALREEMERQGVSTLSGPSGTAGGYQPPVLSPYGDAIASGQGNASSAFAPAEHLPGPASRSVGLEEYGPEGRSGAAGAESRCFSSEGSYVNSRENRLIFLNDLRSEASAIINVISGNIAREIGEVHKNLDTFFRGTADRLERVEQSVQALIGALAQHSVASEGNGVEFGTQTGGKKAKSGHGERGSSKASPLSVPEAPPAPAKPQLGEAQGEKGAEPGPQTSPAAEQKPDAQAPQAGEGEGQEAGESRSTTLSTGGSEGEEDVSEPEQL